MADFDRDYTSPPPVYSVCVDVAPPSYESVVHPTKGGPVDNVAGPVVTVAQPSTSTRPIPAPQSATDTTQTERTECPFNEACCKQFCKASGESKFNVIACCVFTVWDIHALLIGASLYSQCPADDFNIPKFLVIYGIFAGIFHAMAGVEEYVFSVRKGLSKEEREKRKPGGIKTFQFLLAGFGFGYFIYGCVIVLRSFDHFDHSDSMAEDYCHPALYYFAFAMIVFSLSFLAMLILLGCLITWGKFLSSK